MRIRRRETADHELPFSKSALAVDALRTAVLPAATFLLLGEALDATTSGLITPLAGVVLLAGLASVGEVQTGTFLAPLARLGAVAVCSAPAFLLPAPVPSRVLAPLLAAAILERGRRRSLRYRHRTPIHRHPVHVRLWLDRRVQRLTALTEARWMRKTTRARAELALAHAYHSRFHEVIGGESGDLDLAVRYQRQALARLPPGVLNTAAGSDLATILMSRANLRLDLADMDEARSLLVAVLDREDDEPQSTRYARLRVSMSALTIRRALMAELQGNDGDPAGETISRALDDLDLLASEHARPDWLRMVALLTAASYRLHRCGADNSERRSAGFLTGMAGVIEELTAAVEIADSRPPATESEVDDWWSARSHLALALALRHRYAAEEEWRQGRPGPEHHRARRLLDQVLGAPRIPLFTGLTAALPAAGLCMDVELARGAWSEAESLGRMALEGLRVAVEPLYLVPDRETVIGLADGIHHKLAYAMAGRPPDPEELHEFVSILETGRAMAFTEALRREETAGLTDRLIAIGHTDLAARLKTAVTRSRELSALQLREYDARGERLRGLHVESGRQTVQDVLRDQHFTTRTLVRQAREALGDTEDRLELNDRLILAAARHPLCYLLHVPAGSDGIAPRADGLAVLLLPESDLPGSGIKTVIRRLPGLTAENVGRWLTESEREFPAGLLREIGSRVMEPVLDAAGRPDRLTLLPDGLLSALPLHAAILPSGRSVLFDTTVHHAPTASVMAGSRRRGARLRTGNGLPERYVGIAEPLPTAHRRLAGAVPETETAARFYARPRIVPRQRATPQAVREVLQAAAGDPESPAVLHFACHAFADPDEPLKSHVPLAGDSDLDPRRLTLTDLLQMSLTGTRLAILSACRTAEPGFRLPNEFVSLGSAFLQVGAVGVIATLTEVDDQTCRAVVSRFHLEWTARPDDPAKALRLAQTWFALSAPEDIARWLADQALGPRIHPSVIADAQAALSWAPFAYYGV